MHNATDLLLRAFVGALAPDQRILLVGESFDTLLMLASLPVKELVALSEGADPDAPPGKTEHGGLLRMRPDWKERPNSKDLIVDLSGEAPLAEVERVLKKQGLYLCFQKNEVIEGLAHSEQIELHTANLAYYKSNPNLPTETHGLLDLTCFVASKSLIELPAFSFEIERSEEVAENSQESVNSQIQELKDALESERTAHQASKDAHASEILSKNNEFASIQSELKNSQARIAELEKSLAESAAKIDSLKQDEEEFEAVRQELAERRVADKRVDLVEAHHAQIMQSLTSELEELRARTLELDDPHADAKALEAERDSALKTGQKALNHLQNAACLFASWPQKSVAPVLSDVSLVDSWLKSVGEAFERSHQEQNAKNDALSKACERAEQNERRVRELSEALQVLTSESHESEQPIPQLELPLPSDQEAQIQALEKALEAERALRRADMAAYKRLEHDARLALEERDARRQNLQTARRDAARARLEKAALEDEIRRLRSELTERKQSSTDLNAMLTEHANMIELLTASLQEACESRDEAESQRRMAEESLRILRAEFERRG